MKIAFVGTGYVGLVTGAVFAGYGYDVYCIDINSERVASLKQGSVPFYEPGLEDHVKKGLQNGNLHFTTDFKEGVDGADTVFICVGTPPLQNGEVDLSQLKSASQMVAEHLTGYTVIAIKSTVPIGVEEELEKIIEEHKPKSATYEFASVPEFLSEGTALENTMHPDRLVFGVNSQKAADVLLTTHKNISGERIVTDLRSAQMIKYAANSFLATKVSFANGVANVAEKVGANALTVLYGMGLDKRIGQAFFKPGIGFGGSCLPKDVQAFYDIAVKNGYNFDLLRAAYAMNTGQVDLTLSKVHEIVGQDLSDKKIAILGLSFKPDTDDIREAPALKIIDKLLSLGAMVQAYDPVAIPNAKKYYTNSNSDKLHFVQSVDECVNDADCLIIATEWEEFAGLDLTKAKSKMKAANLIDGRNIIDPQKAKDAGFAYIGIGRK